MIVKFKLFRNGKTPTYAKDDDAGMDLYAAESGYIRSYSSEPIRTGVGIAIPRNHVGLIVGRSGLAARDGIDVIGGVIDPGYTGELRAILFNGGTRDWCYEEGDRIAQMLIVPCVRATLEEVKELEETARGESGLGSSGR